MVVEWEISNFDYKNWPHHTEDKVISESQQRFKKKSKFNKRKILNLVSTMIFEREISNFALKNRP